jgi:hypothetical protein
MANLPKKLITDRKGNDILPITHVSAVYDDNGTSVETLLTNIDEDIEDKGYVPTLNAEPTSSTTTYTKSGQTKSFEIGQFCRVADANEDSGYKFYQLKDLTTVSDVTTAAWEEAGKGSDGPVYNEATRSIDFPAGYNISYDETNRTVIIG